jgi:hypothetical protein
MPNIAPGTVVMACEPSIATEDDGYDRLNVEPGPVPVVVPEGLGIG